MFLQTSAGGRGRVKEIWGQSDLFRSLGLTGEMSMRRIWRTAERLRVKQQGACVPLSWAAPPRGGETRKLSVCSSHLCSSPADLIRFSLFEHKVATR